MKYLFMTLVVLGSYIAKSETSPVHVAPQAIAQFQKTFRDATNVEWTEVGALYRVQFNYNSQLLYAFYNSEGYRVCVGKTISLKELPVLLQAEVQKRFSAYEVTDLFELSSDTGTSYYVTIADKKKRMILQSVNNISWTVYSKSKIQGK